VLEGHRRRDHDDVGRELPFGETRAI
jgi:hypothetical protein